MGPMTDDHNHRAGGGPGRLTPADARAVTGPVTAFSVAISGGLTAVKIAGVVATGSVAMLASMADSALDLVAALGTFFAVRYAAAPADAEHRYGHGKAEAFAALFQAGIITLSAALLGREAVSRLIAPAPIERGGLAIAIMVASMALTAALLWAQTRAVRATGSVAVEGDRLHYLSDLAANAAVMIGLVLALAGWTQADAISAGVVALWLLWSAWRLAGGAVNQMMDRELPDQDRERIAALAQEDPRVRAVHQLRTRAAGPLVHIQFHADLDPAMSLETAHGVMVAAEERILEIYPGADILIHPDPQGRAQPHGAPHFRSEEEAHEG
jgi:cation diffusion facilitator family transporter